MTRPTDAAIAHPIQPLCLDAMGTLRFKANAIVRHLLDNGGISLNDIACMDFTREDREQFAQLIGYSHSGSGDLSYMSDGVWYAAQDEYEARTEAAMSTNSQKVTAPAERVQIPAESEHVASCVAEVPLGYFDQLSKEIKTWPALDESKFADFPSLLDGMDAPHTPPDGKVACPIPTCRAELLPGQACGGVNCGLRRTE